MPISDRRLLELAMSGLEAQRERIDEELASLQSRARGVKGASKGAGVKAGKSRKGRRKMSAAEKKALSARMKQIWAARKKAQK
jgi:ribosomal protein S30